MSAWQLVKRAGRSWFDDDRLVGGTRYKLRLMAPTLWVVALVVGLEGSWGLAGLCAAVAAIFTVWLLGDSRRRRSPSE